MNIADNMRFLLAKLSVRISVWNIYEEQKILSRIEKRINKILRKSQKNSPKKVCKDTLFDAIRYTAQRYEYKRRFLNKERADWELFLLISFGVLALIVVLLIWLIGKLI